MLASVSTGFFPNSTSPPLSAVLTKFNNVDNISQFQSNFTISTKFQIFYQGFQENDNVENTDNADNTDKLLNTDILDNKDFSTIKTLIRVIPNFCYFFLHFFPLHRGAFYQWFPKVAEWSESEPGDCTQLQRELGRAPLSPLPASLSTNQISSPVINTCLDFLFEAA